MVTLTEWLNEPANVAFAWAKDNLASDQTDRRRLLLNDAKERETALDHLSVFVVASELERRLLIARIEKEDGLPSGSGRVAIHSYQSLLHVFRSPECIFWQKQSVNFFCQLDLHFSASFCVSIIQFMYAVRTNAFRTRCRFLMMVPCPELLNPVCQALRLVCPEEIEFTRVTLPALDAKTLPSVSACPVEDFVDLVVDRAISAIWRQKTVIVFCTKDTATKISFELATWMSPSKITQNEVAYTDIIGKKCLPVPNKEETVILFMTEIDHVPLNFQYATTIFIEGLKDMSKWERGRIVRREQALTLHEQRRMVAYWHQCQYSTEIIMADQPYQECYPDRLVNHAQSWGFLADLALHFKDIHLILLAGCFVQDPVVLEQVTAQFATLGFLKENPMTFPRPFTVSSKAEHLAKVLGLLDHDFHLAWFVCVGMQLPGASITAKRAILRIAALAKSNFAVVFRNAFGHNFLTRKAFKTVVNALVEKLSGHASMPRHLYTHGLLWNTLMIWHLAQKTVASIRSGELQSPWMEWDDVPYCVLDLHQCVHVSEIVRSLDGYYGIEATTADTLHLADADCELIQKAFSTTWMHMAMTATLRDKAVEVADVVSGTTKEDVFKPESGDTFVPGLAFGTPGTSKNMAVFAALQLCARGDSDRFFNNAVVLPMEILGSWRSPSGDIFSAAVRYRGP